MTDKERPLRITIPESLAQTRGSLTSGSGCRWLQQLPAIVEECARAWDLQLAEPFPQLSYNWAAPATWRDGTSVVLKVCYPNRELFSEIAALKVFDGRGAVRLLAVDQDRGALLLERCDPGTPVAREASDEQKTAAIAAVIRRLPRPVLVQHPFSTFGDWIADMATNYRSLVSPTSQFPVRWIERALAKYADLVSISGDPVVLHGDLHHGNILAAQREPWLAIDPKGVVGDPICETGPLLLNELPEPWDEVVARRLLARRVDQLVAELGFDRERLRAWGVVRAVLAAYWSLEDHGQGWESAIVVADTLSALGT
jgi:streptomycin 6-kinase